MGIIPYKKNSSDDKKVLYMVVAEAVNRFSGQRVQKKRRGISSLPKAERIYRELWLECRDSKPIGLQFSYWEQLIESYFTCLSEKIRSDKNPNGFSPHVVKSKKSRLNHTKRWFGTHLELITPQFVMNGLDGMESNGVSRSMTNHILKEIKCVFTYALHLGVINSNLFAGLKMRKMPRKRKEALTHEEVNVLLTEAKRRGHEYYIIWILTVTLGLRRSELAGLKWIDIDFTQRLIYLRRQKIPREGVVEFLKDREERVVAIPQNILPVLKELKLRTQSDFVINVKCHKWNEGHQAQVLRQFCKEIGIKEITHHQLRATHITLALIDGVPLGIVKENVGHSKLSTTDEYFRSAGINMRGQTDGLRIQVPAEESATVLPMKR